MVNNSLKIYIKTFGCQMNDRDSEALGGMFLKKGDSLVDDPKKADVILVNTCSIRQHAEERALSFVGTFKKLKNKPIIGIIGCMAKRQGEEIIRKMPYVSIVCGPSRLYYIPEYVDKVRNLGIKVVDTEDGEVIEGFYEGTFLLDPNHAQVVISIGCSNYCTYCVVPYVRGELRLRRPENIVNEIKKFIGKGVRKFTLLGQNVNDYQYKYTDRVVNFPELLEIVASLEGVEELNFITSHPKNTSMDLFYVMAKYPNIKKHLHLPLQSGSDRILKLMNRGYTRRDYLHLVENFYKIVQGTLSTDIIVGFPQEEEEDFLLTKDILERVRFKYAYIFKYSVRPNTKSSLLEDNVKEEVKERRHKILLELQKKISLEYV